MNRRSILSIGAATALGLGLLPASTVAQQKSLKDQLSELGRLYHGWRPSRTPVNYNDLALIQRASTSSLRTGTSPSCTRALTFRKSRPMIR
jgi:hypothetical protein